MALESLLDHAPLVEAIFEMRWHLPEGGGAGKPPSDPNYPLLLGSFYREVKADYPYHEKLPAAEVPSELVPHTVQHRFRSGRGEWPLVQLGPGIMSVNDTESYRWEGDFLPRCVSALSAVRTQYPNQPPEPTAMMLRYVNALEFDYLDQNLFEFLNDKLGIGVAYSKEVFEKTGTKRRPEHLNWDTSFPVDAPKGSIGLKLGTGSKHGDRALIWEIRFRSEVLTPVEDDWSDLQRWLQDAHLVVEKWFLGLAEGELLESFK